MNKLALLLWGLWLLIGFFSTSYWILKTNKRCRLHWDGHDIFMLLMGSLLGVIALILNIMEDDE